MLITSKVVNLEVKQINLAQIVAVLAYLPDFVKYPMDLSGFVQICSDMLKYPQICPHKFRFTHISADMHGFSRICPNLSRFDQIFFHLLKFVQICPDIPILCPDIPGFSGLTQIFQAPYLGSYWSDTAKFLLTYGTQRELLIDINGTAHGHSLRDEHLKTFFKYYKRRPISPSMGPTLAKLILTYRAQQEHTNGIQVARLKVIV
ncbi:hypothetical protein HZH68_002902 [Vespula germanica]|uniref:Uncharacterized protein n=1 Tax=Vespula germanica TaxID=30212 RepID=A0A834NN53_VESGE|nr:hypothetical protein HZH68_002902 [Vespula germanica]